MSTDVPDAEAFAEDDGYLAALELPTVTEEQQSKLQAYAEQVHETNQHTNLTGAKDLDTIWTRHVLDSLYLAPLLAGSEKLLDIGSGGGFPALPLGILYPDLSVTMLESTGKKVRFLNACAESLPCPAATAIHERAEKLGHHPQHRGQYDVVTARAVTSLSALIELSLPFLKVGGHLLAMKGRKAEEEIIAAEHALDALKGEITGFHEYGDSEENEACVVRVTKMQPTPGKFPRAVGIPSNTPL
jgi:16S rRNA (guanine527-N7)-methyltransferase